MNASIRRTFCANLLGSEQLQSLLIIAYEYLRKSDEAQR